MARVSGSQQAMLAKVQAAARVNVGIQQCSHQSLYLQSGLRGCGTFSFKAVTRGSRLNHG